MNRKGFAILEVVLVVALFAIFSTGIFYLSLDSLKRSSVISLDSVALLYAQEGLEASRNIRDRSFLELQNGDHGVELVGGEWVYVAAPQVIDEVYERTIEVQSVYRDGAGDIAEDGSELDPDLKRVVSEVGWVGQGVGPNTIRLETYLSNWRGDDWIVTTCTDFNEGEFDGTEVVSAPSPPADNCELTLEGIVSIGQTYGSADVGSHGVDVVVDGNYAFLGVNNASGGFSSVDISDDENPFVLDTVDVGGKGNYVHKSGNYVYVGVEHVTDGLAIVDVSNPASLNVVATVDVDGRGNEPNVVGDNLFMAVDDKIMVFDVSNPASPVFLDEFDFNDEVYVSEFDDDYLYVGLAADDLGLRVLDVSDPANLSEVASLDVGEEVNAIEVDWPVVYAGTEDDNNSLHVIDITDPENPVDQGAIDVGGEIEDLGIYGDELYAALNVQNSGMALIDISSPYSPVLEENLDLGAKSEGVDVSGTSIYYAVDTANKGLLIIGRSVSAYTVSGEYVSSVLDTGSVDPEYKMIDWDSDVVPGSNVILQIRTASSEAGIDVATWVGDDGTSSSFYETPRTQIVLSPGASGSRYIQYRVVIQSDEVNASSVGSVRINYVP